jgi:hypothetical protein
MVHDSSLSALVKIVTPRGGISKNWEVKPLICAFLPLEIREL